MCATPELVPTTRTSTILPALPATPVAPHVGTATMFGGAKAAPPMVRLCLFIVLLGSVNVGLGTSPTSTWPICAPGCSNCMGPDASECLSAEQNAFVGYVAAAYSLPILAETADHRICFRNLLPDIGCTPDPIEYATGAIKDYGTPSPKPTTFQCYKLLNFQWFFITHWFGQLFPTFLGPAGATEGRY